MVINIKHLVELHGVYGRAYAWLDADGTTMCASMHIHDVPYGGRPFVMIDEDGTVTTGTTTVLPGA